MHVPLLIISLLFFSIIHNALAEEDILISLSADRDEVIFDGRWSFVQEWKRSSLNEFYYEGERIILRSAHQDEFLYFHINFLTDETLDRNSDRATICIDSKNEKNIFSDLNDYCFVAVVNEKQGMVLQGGTNIGLNGNFKKISNPDGYLSIGAMSNKNDRYSEIPHTSYEFKIPTSLVGRSDSYGFFVSVYEADSKNTYTWPQYIEEDVPFKIPSPSKWGNLVSPDKSIPEFGWPLLAIIPSFFLIILLSSRLKNNNFLFKF